MPVIQILNSIQDLHPSGMTVKGHKQVLLHVRRRMHVQHNPFFEVTISEEKIHVHV